MVFVSGGAFTPRAREFLERVPNARVEKPIDLQNLRLLLATSSGEPGSPERRMGGYGNRRAGRRSRCADRGVTTGMPRSRRASQKFCEHPSCPSAELNRRRVGRIAARASRDAPGRSGQVGAAEPVARDPQPH